MGYRSAVGAFRVLAALLVMALVGAGTFARAQEGAGNTTPPFGRPQASAAGDYAPAEIVNDEGGPVRITGTLTYTNLNFTMGVAQPLVILEDQAGFVDRDRHFLFSPESQVLGQFTSDFFTSPVSYSLALPIEPQGAYRNVADSSDAIGVQVYAVAYWTNKWGDPFLEERDLYGGGWSTAYASTRVSEDASARYEIVGGRLLIYAPDDAQGFPAGFGDDGLLFTADDPIVRVPQGYTVVDLDTNPFTFDRSRHAVIDLIEPTGIALDDFSDLSYTDAFDAMIDKMSREYAFTEYKGIDWEAMADAFRPRVEEAERAADRQAYLRALRDFTWAIPDGHISGPFIFEDFQTGAAGGLGMLIRELDDGRVIVTYLSDNGAAQRAGIQLRAEIVEINGRPVSEVIGQTTPWTSPFSTEHNLRLTQMRDAIRFPIGTRVEVAYRNPGNRGIPTIATLVAVSDPESWTAWWNQFTGGRTGIELPVQYRLLDGGFLYAGVNSFSDNELLTVQLWERMIETLNNNNIPGVVVDMRQNGGGSGFLADQMAAYFFDEPLVLGSRGSYNEELGAFYFDPDPRAQERFYLPPEHHRYHGNVAVLVGPNCASACERFAYAMTLQGRAQTVGHYPTAGLGGGVEDFRMPEGQVIRFTVSRSVNAEGEIHIEGVGVAPTLRVPVTEATLFSASDPVLDAAVAYLRGEAVPQAP